jgi:hypothetical protein
MNLGLGFLVLALHLPTGAKLNVLDISVCEQMDIVTNHPLRLLVRFVLSFPLSVSPFSNFALAYPKSSSGKLHLCPGGQLWERLSLEQQQPIDQPAISNILDFHYRLLLTDTLLS